MIRIAQTLSTFPRGQGYRPKTGGVNGGCVNSHLAHNGVKGRVERSIQLCSDIASRFVVNDGEVQIPVVVRSIYKLLAIAQSKFFRLS